MRAQLQLVDVILAFFVLVAILALAPFIYHFIDMVSAEADPLTALLMALIPPFLIIGLIVSAGVSAR